MEKELEKLDEISFSEFDDLDGATIVVNHNDDNTTKVLVNNKEINTEVFDPIFNSFGAIFNENFVNNFMQNFSSTFLPLVVLIITKICKRLSMIINNMLKSIRLMELKKAF